MMNKSDLVIWHKKMTAIDNHPMYAGHKLDPNRELTGQFRDYLTEIDVTDPRETLPEDYQRHLGSK